MTTQTTQTTRDTCDAYANAIAAGEAQVSIIGYLAKLYDVQRPAIWKRLRSGGLIPDYGFNDGKPIGRNAGGIRRAEPRGLMLLPPIIDREPCPRCGVRADIGCNHSRAPLGMVL